MKKILSEFIDLFALLRVINWQHPWRLAIGDNGKVVAIVQDICLEIRTSRDDYLSIVGKAACK